MTDGAAGPDLYTLRGWVELELALEAGVRVDAAHAVLSDALTQESGPELFGWLAEALVAEGRSPDDFADLLDDDDLAERVLAVLRARLAGEDPHAEPPGARLVWSAYSPDDPSGGREAFRRAVRRRAQTARHALLAPRRPHVAGRRDER
ncbi:hypothetical protein [Blastococcus sp. LR1]|uniref:hypothetical protein n=1 Tax=Blastococcus sp. LR1 TaxID=2877000 RepID=UPI001CCD4785|nr:hypothetical protein [Blastococcus sp. LR1]MCA0144793.1 hypothetical protein [Blastococcus sp. LR1]